MEDLEKDTPEGFIWACYNRSGNKKGCRRGWHSHDLDSHDHDNMPAIAKDPTGVGIDDNNFLGDPVEDSEPEI